MKGEGDKEFKSFQVFFFEKDFQLKDLGGLGLT